MSNRHAAEQRQLVARLFDEASTAMERANWQVAVVKLDQVMDIAPDFPGADWRHFEAHRWYQVDKVYELGQRRMGEGDWSEALQHFRRVQQQVGAYKNTKLLMGICERRLFDTPRAYPLLRPPPRNGGRFATGLATAAVLVGCFILSLSALFGQAPATPSVTNEVAINPVVATPTLQSSETTEPDLPTATPESRETASAMGETSTPSAIMIPIGSQTPAAFIPTSTATPRPTATRTPTRVIPLSTSTRTPTNSAPTAQATATSTSTTAATTTTQPTATATGDAVVTFLSPTPTPTATRAPTSTTLPTASATATTAPINITASEYQFVPSNLSVSAGSRLRFNVTNKGTQDHDWMLKDSSGRELLKMETRPGQSDSREFTFVSSGIYTFVCDLADYAQQGMTGRLTVR